MTSIVTKTGDNGTTGLLEGSRVSKASPRLHAYGTVDELNAIIGLALAEEDLPAALRNHLGSLQHILFRLGTDIATPTAQAIHAIPNACHPELVEGRHATARAMVRRAHHDTLPSPQTQFGIKCMDNDDVEELEQWIKELEEKLPPLRHFIVPGGSRVAALLHCARTVCRRAERWAVALAEKEHMNPQARIFLNRLSDHLFLAARSVNAHRKKDDVCVEPQRVRRPMSASRRVT